MASANRLTRQLSAFSLRVVLLVLSIVALSAVLCGQSSTPASGAAANSAGIPSQVQTSAQNSVLGSVPDAKPVAGVLPLTFRDAIERALRHNLAGLLSEYN